MPPPPAASDAEASRLAHRKLRLLIEIDQIRDQAEDPHVLLSSLARTVSGEIGASTGLLFIVDQDRDGQELRAVLSSGGSAPPLPESALRTLAERTLEVTAVEPLPDADVPDALRRHAPIVVVPIVLGERERLGTLLLGLGGEPFGPVLRDLLEFAESQLDSALLQARRIFELDVRKQELETIYRFDQIRDEQHSFDEMLDRVSRELRRVIRGDLAFIMLYDAEGREMETRAIAGDDLSTGWSSIQTVEKIARQAVRAGRQVVEEHLDGVLGSVICTPLILRDRILGVFGMASSHPTGFRERERRLLAAIASQMDTAIFESLEQRRLRQVLGRSVDPRVMERLLASSDVAFLKGERQLISVLFADLRGSTRMAERVPPEPLVEFINDFLGTMSGVILRHEGTLDKFVGDQVIALFGAPFPLEDHALRAVRVGLAMQAAHQEVIGRWSGLGMNPCPLGVGIATGELIVGEMGSAQRSDYTAIGKAANLGARICGVAEAGQVLISPATYEVVAERVVARPIEGRQFKGVSDEITVYHVTGEA